MVKNLIIYTLFLVCADFLINLVVNFIQGNPGIMIVTSVIVRAGCLFVLFPSIGGSVFVVLKGKGSNTQLIITTLIVYLLFPLIIYSLKSNDKNLLEVYLDLNLQLNLFVLIYVPYLLASVICLVLSDKLKLFDLPDLK